MSKSIVHIRIASVLVLLMMDLTTGVAQSTTYPKEIRGYKVERAAVEPRQTNTSKANDQIGNSQQTQLIEFGTPRVAQVTPLGINLETPVVVSPVRQKG